MSMLYQQIGDLARARSWMAFYLNHAIGPDPEANAIYGRLSAQTQ
jgi:hypothetical protein